jgi:hypothetical protein
MRPLRSYFIRDFLSVFTFPTLKFQGNNEILTNGKNNERERLEVNKFKGVSKKER